MSSESLSPIEAGPPLQLPVPHPSDNSGSVAGPPVVTWRPNVVCQPLTMAKTHDPVYVTNAHDNTNVSWAPTVTLTTGSQKSNICDQSFLTGNLPTTIACTEPQSHATFNEAGCSQTYSIPITLPSNPYHLNQLTSQTANLEI